jgi:hypothetical protein
VWDVENGERTTGPDGDVRVPVDCNTDEIASDALPTHASLLCQPLSNPLGSYPLLIQALKAAMKAKPNEP